MKGYCGERRASQSTLGTISLPSMGVCALRQALLVLCFFFVPTNFSFLFLT